MSRIDKNLTKALEITFSEEIHDKSLKKFLDAIPYFLENYSEKELDNPMFVSFISKIPELIREYRCLEFLEDNKDSIEKYPGDEKTAKRCLEEIFRARYRPGYAKGKDYADIGQAS